MIGRTVNGVAQRDRWNIAKGTIDGAPIIVRALDGVARAKDRTQWPVRIGVAIPLLEPDDRGFPQADELTFLDEIEGRIDETTSADRRAVLVAMITGKSMREFVLHARDGDWVEAWHLGLRAEFGSHDVQCVAQLDPDWTAYLTLVGGPA